MGGRKQRRPVRTKPLPSIPKIFDCPQCEATAIRIKLESDLATVECGSCHLKKVVTEIKAIEEPIDIYGNFVDMYYAELDLSKQTESSEIKEIEDTPEIIEPENVTEEVIEADEGGEEEPEVEEESQVEEIEEEMDEEPEPMGFIPRSKADIKKKKQKPKEKKKKIVL